MLTGITTCVFDAYGTLFDVRSVAAACRAALGEKTEAVTAVWRQKQLEYTWLRTLMRHHADFWQVTDDALAYALDAHGLLGAVDRAPLLDAYLRPTPYDDVPDALARLRAAGLRTAILSNGTPRMLDAGVRNGGLADHLDAVLSVESVGVFKPDPAVYRHAAERLGAAPHEIAFLSTNAWDVAGAAAFGLRVVWLNRFGHRPERLPVGPEAEITTLAALPGLLRA